MGKLEVIKVLGLATVQDMGRFGYRQFGIPQSGAMDVSAMHLVNFLVGNQPDQPVIEMAMNGVTLKALESTIVAVSGAEVPITINNEIRALNTSYQLATGDVLSTGFTKKGVYSYLGVGGEIIATNSFGSKSTYMLAGFGGIDGKALKPGVILESTNSSPFVERFSQNDVESGKLQSIRIIKGPEWRLLRDDPQTKVFEIDPSSNRMGIRTLGEPLGIDKKEITSSAVIPGTIQVPSNGLPIILMRDCQTTGGYPRIAKVVDEDLALLAQVEPGGRINFILNRD